MTIRKYLLRRLNQGEKDLNRDRQLVASGQLNWVSGKGNRSSLQTHTADFGPDLELLGPGSSVLGGSDVIAAEMEEVVDLIVGGEEPLRLAGRFEPLHLPLSSARRLVRVFRSVVEPLGKRSLNPTLRRAGRIG